MRNWRQSLPGALKSTTRSRLINDLKAALNRFYELNRGNLKAAIPESIKHGLRLEREDDVADTVARENQILSDAQVARLLQAARETDQEQGWDGDPFRMIVVLAATGARFLQASRVVVGDLQAEAGRVLVPPSRKGRGVKVGSIAFPVGGDVLHALAPAAAGRDPQAPLLERWRHRQDIGSIEWRRSERGPWLSASEITRPWQVIRERAGLPATIPYSLRHSSIVRCLRANLPARLVAAMHDTSVGMLERHYARWIVDGLEDVARRAVVQLVQQEGSSSGG